MIAGVDGITRGWVAVTCNDDLSDPHGRFVDELLPRGRGGSGGGHRFRLGDGVDVRAGAAAPVIVSIGTPP